MNCARRQEYRRLARAAAASVAKSAALLLGLAVASIGVDSLAAVLVVVALVLALYARHWFSLAGRSQVGARSEDEVRRALTPLRTEGWCLRHSLSWRGREDIDLVAIAPGGFAFAIEVKTRRYENHHLALVREQAAWLWRFRRRWYRLGAVPVLCVARGRGVQRYQRGRELSRWLTTLAIAGRVAPWRLSKGPRGRESSRGLNNRSETGPELPSLVVFELSGWPLADAFR